MTNTKDFDEIAIDICREWKTFWMNQKQHSEDDYKNYLHRAMGIDANMRCHLEELISKALKDSYLLGRDEILGKLPSDDELLNANRKYMKSNKTSKNSFDDLDFAYYHGQLDFIDDLKSRLEGERK